MIFINEEHEANAELPIVNTLFAMTAVSNSEQEKIHYGIIHCTRYQNLYIAFTINDLHHFLVRA